MQEFRDDLLDSNVGENRLSRKKQRLKKLIGPDRLFSGMAQYFVYKIWKLDLD